MSKCYRWYRSCKTTIILFVSFFHLSTVTQCIQVHTLLIDYLLNHHTTMEPNKNVWAPDIVHGYIIGKIVDILQNQVSVQTISIPSQREPTHQPCHQQVSNRTLFSRETIFGQNWPESARISQNWLNFDVAIWGNSIQIYMYKYRMHSYNSCILTIKSLKTIFSLLFAISLQRQSSNVLTLPYIHVK